MLTRKTLRSEIDKLTSMLSRLEVPDDSGELLPSANGIDRIIFGSDWPHPEGLADPINLVDDLVAHGLDDEGVKKVMGRNMVDLFKVDNKIVHKPDVPALVLPA